MRPSAPARRPRPAATALPGLALLLALAPGCEPAGDKSTDTAAEGAGEDDPASPYELPQFPELLPELDLPDLSDIRPTPAAAEACYLGPDRDDRACLPTVEWDAAWGDAYAYPDPYGDDDQYLAPVRFLDLDSIDPDTRIAPNFVLSEVASAAKGRFGLFQAHTVDALQQIRDDIGGPLRVNSGYRNVDYNAGVGGATYSRHQYGDGVDIAADGASLDELAALCGGLGAGYVDVYATHVHCDWRTTPLDPAFYPVTATSLQPAPGGGHHIAGLAGPEGLRRALWTLEDADGEAILEGSGATVPPVAGAVRLVLRLGPLGPPAVFALSSR